MAEDYYELLGIERTATPQEIKKAFRKKALEHHPDRADDPKVAEEKFKEINAAYAVLSDPKKRAAFDRYGAEGFHQQYSREDIFRDFDQSSIADILGGLGFGGDVFARIFGGGRPGGRGARVEFGGSPFGAGARPAAGPSRGADMEAKLQTTFAEAVMGGERLFSFALPGGGNRSLKVTIPPGSRDGGRLRLRGQGDPAGGAPGDLYLVLAVEPHPRIRARGERDLEVDIGVDLLDLVLGGSAVVPTLGGDDKRIKVRPGTQPGTPIRLRGFGVPASSTAPAGDLYANIRVTIPTQLSADQTELFEKLRESGL